MAGRPSVLIIACGALAHEIMALIRLNGWEAFDVKCLPADLHNTPDQIPGRVQTLIEEARGRYERVFVAYADCGTGGLLDKVLEETGVERLPGAHCYQFFAGADRFDALHDAEPGTFYLTDFLVKTFDRVIIRGLGIDRHPELMPIYFGNYRRLVYLSQQPDDELMRRARQAAERLGLEFAHTECGYGELATELERVHHEAA